MTNGAGMRLGEAALEGMEGVATFIRVGLVWGWDLQAGTAPASDLHLLAARGAAAGVTANEASAGSSPVSANSNSAEHAQQQQQQGSVVPIQSCFLRTAPYLLACNETGITTALRRLLELYQSTPASLVPSGSVNNAAYAFAGAAAPAVSALEETIAVVWQLQHIRQRCASSAHFGLAAAAASKDARSSETLLGLGDRLVEAMQSTQGLALPLTCGHNATWSALETSMAVRAVLSAVHASTGGEGDAGGVSLRSVANV